VLGVLAADSNGSHARQTRARRQHGRDQEARSHRRDGRRFPSVRVRKDGKPTGFDNELVDDLKKYAPFEIKQEISALDRHPGRREQRASTTSRSRRRFITKERKKSLDFTSPIADATHYYVKRKVRREHQVDQGPERKDLWRASRQRASRPPA